MDRNDNGNAVAVSDLESLSARRAWIEIFALFISCKIVGVALRKESVDRNFISLSSLQLYYSRSPQGERG